MVANVRKHVAWVFAGFGAGAFTIGSVADGLGWDDLRAAGATIIIGAVAAIAARSAVKPALLPIEDVYEAGYSSGLDKGYYDGRRANKLNVVPIRPDNTQTG